MSSASSSPSIKSTSSSRTQPRWRTISTYSKKIVPSSLSLISAQAEAAARLPSAVKHLIPRMLSDDGLKKETDDALEDGKRGENAGPERWKSAEGVARGTEQMESPTPISPAHGLSSNGADEANVSQTPSGPTSAANVSSESGLPAEKVAPDELLRNDPTMNVSQSPSGSTSAANVPSEQAGKGLAPFGADEIGSTAGSANVSQAPSRSTPAANVSSEQAVHTTAASSVNEANCSTSPTGSAAPVISKPSAQTVISKRSWFGSLSWAKSPEVAVDISEERPVATVVPTSSLPAAVTASDPSPSQPQQPTTAAIPPRPPQEQSSVVRVDDTSSSDAPTPTRPVSVPAKRTWFASPSHSPVRNSSPTSAPPSMPMTPSSVDEEVPKLLMSNVERPAATVSGDAHQRLSSLNPSTSRFSLSLPLLGRPKVPLDKALASAKASDIRAPVFSEYAPPRDAKAETATPEVEGIAHAQEEPLQPEPRDSANLVGTQSEQIGREPLSSASQSSWWGLATWGSGSSTPKSHAGERVAVAEIPSNDAADPSPAVADATSPAPADAPNPSPPEVYIDSVPAEGEAPGPTMASLKAMSTRSQDTQTSTWYTPWTWYTAQTTTTTAVVETEADGKTAAEVVKEEALAREEPVPPPALEPAPEPASEPARSTPASELPNPIEKSIAANLPGWASFFSSRTLTAKRVTDAERDENGMEVMEIEDTDEGDQDATLVATSEDTASGRHITTTTQTATAPGKQASAARVTRTEVKPVLKEKLGKRKSASPAPSKDSSASSAIKSPPPPNLVLPTWDATFHEPPRSIVPSAPPSTLQRTMKFVSGFLGEGRNSFGKGKGKARARELDEEMLEHFGKALPRAWDVMGEQLLDADVLRGCKRVAVIGIHGWFPGAVMRSVIGEPTGTSSKFVAMMCQALDVFQENHNVKFDKITEMPLEGEGTINKRVDKLYEALTSNKEWMDDLHAADVIFVAAHSQGSIVSTHLLDRLIHDKHIRTSRLADVLGSASAAATSFGGSVHAPLTPQRVCCLALCGIHLGPLRYLNSNSLIQPYFQYFESAAARELFEFQNTENEVSKNYVKALSRVLDHGTKMVYVASLNDQVVPIYSGVFTAASHPLILRALYIDGDAYHSSDFLTNLLVLLTRILNSGLSDSGLTVHLSEATAGSLNGIGHSTAYEELATYSLAVNYLFMANHGLEEHPQLTVEQFNANTEQNDYEIPWSLRDLIADDRVAHLFSRAFADLRDAFPHWHPKTTILRDIKRKLQPIQRLNAVASIPAPSSPASPSKL